MPWGYTERMGLDAARWLATLRTRKRALLCVLLPAFALSTVSGAACATVMAAPSMVVGGHEHGGAHAQHSGAHESAPEPRSVPCPHCPLDAGSANVGHAACTIADSQVGAVTPAKDASQHPPVLVVRDWTLPAARATPPLIASLTAVAEPPAPTVPLNLLHCVLVI